MVNFRHITLGIKMCSLCRDILGFHLRTADLNTGNVDRIRSNTCVGRRLAIDIYLRIVRYMYASLDSCFTCNIRLGVSTVVADIQTADRKVESATGRHSLCLGSCSVEYCCEEILRLQILIIRRLVRRMLHDNFREELAASLGIGDRNTDLTKIDIDPRHLNRCLSIRLTCSLYIRLLVNIDK